MYDFLAYDMVSDMPTFDILEPKNEDHGRSLGLHDGINQSGGDTEICFPALLYVTTPPPIGCCVGMR